MKYASAEFGIALMILLGDGGGVESAKGIILRLTKLSDTSLIVTWCVEGRGLVKTVAKGARRAKGGFAGKLDLFYLADLSWVVSRRSELHTLREVSPVDYHSELRVRYRDLLMAAYFVGLVELVMEAGLSDDGVYDLLRRGLGFLNGKGGSVRGLEHFENQLAQLMGVWDGRRTSYMALEDAFGRLPATRGQCVSMF